MFTDMPTLEHAKALRDIGYSVIALAPGSKRPDVAWKPYQERLATDEELATWFAIPRNLAIVTGRVSGGIVGIDIDSAHAKAIAERTLPQTPMKVLTPSAGEHWYFRCNEEVRNGVKLMGTDLDVRGEGGYLACPPSRCLGKPYRWADRILPASELPELDPALIPRRTEENGVIRNKGDGSAAERYVSRIMSISGQGGDSALFKAACALIQKFELPYEVAMSILEHWNLTNAQPRWSDERLRYKLNEAVRLHEGRVDRLRFQSTGEVGLLSIHRTGVGRCILCKDPTPKKGMEITFADGSLKGFCCTRHMLRAIDARGQHKEINNGEHHGEEDGAL